jgi:transposase-like protein
VLSIDRTDSRFLLSEHRDIAAAKRFFIRAIERHGAPERITLDGSPATHSAVAELTKSGVLPSPTKVRTSKYLNNLVEQGHRRVKQRLYPMLGFKNISNATTTISGIELIQKIKKCQFDIERFPSGVKERVPRIWEVVLAA